MLLAFQASGLSAQSPPGARDATIVLAQATANAQEPAAPSKIGEFKLPFKGGAFALSPDGSVFAAGAFDGKIGVFAAKDGTQIFSLEGHTGEIAKLAFGDQGQSLLSASVDGSVRVWNIVSGKETLKVTGPTGIVFSVAMSDDGRLIAAGAEKHIWIWDAQSGKPLMDWGFDDDVYAVAFSPDGTKLAIGSGKIGNKIWIWSFEKSTMIKTLGVHNSDVSALSFSADGKRLASGSMGGWVALWSTDNWDVLAYEETHDSTIANIVFSGDGKRLLTASSDERWGAWTAADPISKIFVSEKAGHYLAGVGAAGEDIYVMSSDGVVQRWRFD